MLDNAFDRLQSLTDLLCSASADESENDGYNAVYNLLAPNH